MTKISNQYSLTNVLFADAVNGRVGIGTETPSVALDVVGAGLFSSNLTVNGTGNFTTTSSSVYDFSIRNSGTGISRLRFGNATSAARLTLALGATDSEYARFGSEGNFPLHFQTNGTDRLTITGAGNVGIGTSSPENITNQTSLSVNGTNASRLDFQILGIKNSGLVSTAAGLYLETSTTIPLVFITNNTERMRITSGGNVGIGTTSPNSKLQIGTMVAYTGSGYTFAMGNGTTDFLITVNAAQSGSSVTFYSSTDYLFNRSGPSSTGVISAYGFNNISDYRLKYDLESFDGLSLISQIKTYKYKMEETHETQYGVLAHEIQEVLPHLVVGVKDGDRMQSVDYQKIVPMLIKSIQEQQTQINELKALLNAH